MGLDMYLDRRIYFGNQYRKDEEQVRVIAQEGSSDSVKKLVESIDQTKVSEIVESACCWRKANAIHKWFVDRIENENWDGESVYFSEEQLKELIETCEQVIKGSKLVKGKVQNGQRYEGGRWVPIMEEGMTIEDPTVAKELLPTEEGFFFGSQDYNEWYLDDIKETVKMLEKALEKGGDFYYSASW